MNKTLIEIINEHGDLSPVCRGQLSIPIGIGNARYCTMTKSNFDFECKSLNTMYNHIYSCEYAHNTLNNGFTEYHLELDNNLGDC